MKNGFDSQRYYTGDRRKTTQRRRMEEEEEIDNISNCRRWSSSNRRRRGDEYGSRHHISLDINYNRSSNRRRREEDSNYDRSSNKRREEESYNRRDDIYHGRSSNRRRRRRREEESNRRRDDIYHGWSSNKRRRRDEESNSRHDDIYHGRSSNKRRRTREHVSLDIDYGPSLNRKRGDDNISLNFHSSQSSYRRRREESSSKNNRHDSCSGLSVIKEDMNMISSSSNCDKSCKYDEDEIDATPVGSFPGFVDDGVVTEILSRLPVISLLRFKSVCKHWRSKITQDQNFIHLHSTHSKKRMKLLCITPLVQQKETETRPQHILTANLSVKRSSGEEGKIIIHNVNKTTDENWFYYDDILEQVNGLVCFIHRSEAAVRIHNVSTREVTPWIESTLLSEEKYKFGSEGNIVSNRLQMYQIGFDPEKKEHKVFCFWRLAVRAKDFSGSFRDTANNYASWEALTVGRDTKWRRISVVPDENNLIKLNEVLPPYRMERNPAHANGTIYWRNKLMTCEEGFVRDFAPTDPDVIIAFDVGSEKFRVIPIPSFILDEIRENKFDHQPIALLILGGHVTLIYQISIYIVKLWMLDDNGVEKRLENCQGKGSSNWSTETITLPFSFCDRRFVGFHGSVAADKILISNYSDIVLGSLGYKRMACLYSYDRKTKTFKKIDEMDEILQISLRNGLSLFTTFTESLVHVQPQQEKDRQLELVC
ncbi:hypothetical protein MKW92_003820 [Papaver armeniacum]|nr:hypothetical protein MKW92_003820 [Papaver armeniacum]